MPTCDNCNNKWSWKQTIKKTTTLNPVMTCPYCEGNQYQTQKSKTKIGFLTPIVLLPLLLQLFFDLPLVFLLIMFPILVMIVFILSPFLIELSSRENYINLSKN